MLKSLKIYFFEIWFLAGRDSRKLFIIFSLYLLIGILDLLGLSLIGQYVAIIFGTNFELPYLTSNLVGRNPYHIGLGLLAVFGVKTLLGIWSNKQVFTVAAEVESGLRVELLKRYQSIPYEAWTARNSSEYINSINIWVPQYSRLVLMPLIRLGAEAWVACLILCFFFAVDYRAFLTLLILVCCITLLYDRLLRKRNQMHAARFKDVSSSVVTDVRQAMDGFKEIRILGAENFFSNRVSRNASELCYVQAVMNTISNSSRYFLEFAIVVFAVLTLLALEDYGSSAVDMVPILAIFGVGTIRLLTLFNLVSVATTQLRFYRPVVCSLYKDLCQELLPLHKTDSNDCFGEFSQITIKDLSFSYSNIPTPILHNINLIIKKGEKIAIVGPSGSGKSTFIDLLLGILQPSRGEINITDEFGRRSGGNVAPYSTYLPQSTFLIDDSIRRNIALGEDDGLIDEVKLLGAIQRSCLTDLIDSLPDGLSTIVGDRGVRLSGGQRQRIAIARAFYFGRTILFLDEATSAIDSETEKAILCDLFKNSNDLTIIFITHRTDILKYFNKIYSVNQGYITPIKLNLAEII